jgi:PEGA domain
LAVIALAFCVIAEAVVIALLLQRRLGVPAPVKVAEVHLETTDPGASVTVDGRSVGVTPLQLAIGSDMRSISIVSQQPATKQELIVGSSGQQSPVVQSPASRSDAPSTSVGSAPQRSGGIRLSSPIDLEVFEGDTRLGSSATGIVSAPAGRRELDLVNSVLGFRLRQVVDIKAGQVVPLAVTPPNGIININAVPWAEVLIDGKVIGETPIGNLSLSLGNHEIIFRHPQFAELRQTALVRSDTITRISVNLQR